MIQGYFDEIITEEELSWKCLHGYLLNWNVCQWIKSAWSAVLNGQGNLIFVTF